MKNKARVLAISLVLLCTAACDVLDDPINLGPSVSGTVVDAVTLAPIEGATVSIAGRQATSATNGAYFISDISKGPQTLKATKQGYANYSEDVTIENGLVQKTIKMTK